MEIISIIYIFIMFFLIYAVGIYPEFNFKNKNNFSIVIPFRDEIDYIEKNYYFLKNQKYVTDLYEVIYVNDHSQDGSEEILNQKEVNYFKMINMKSDEKGKFRGIKKGVLNSENEYIILSDCDSYGGKNYIQSFNRVVNPEDNLYTGFFEIEDSKLFSLDTFFLVGIAASLNFYNLPSSCPGANICVKKKTYKRFLKGKKDDNPLTEDALFLNTVKKNNMGGIHFVFNEENILKTRGYNSLSDFFSQRLRWLKGGFNLDYKLLVFLLFNFVCNILFVINTEYLVVPFVMIFLFLFCVLKRLNRINYILYYPFYFIVYIGYTVVLGIMFILGLKNIEWKGRVYK